MIGDMAEHHRRPDHRPPCPGCGDRMPLTRVVPRGDYVWEQVVFQCHRCDIALTQAGDGWAGCPMSDPVAAPG